MKKYIVIITLLLFWGIGIYMFFYVQENKTWQSGKEWFRAQQDIYLPELASFAKEVDDVYALYINKNIGAEDFINHVNILENELKIIKTVREEYLKKHPITPNSHTYYSKLGCDVIDNCYTAYQALFRVSLEKERGVKKITYDYLVVKSEIQEFLNDYAQTVLYDTSKKGGEGNE